MRVLCSGKVKDNKKVPDFVKNRVLFSFEPLVGFEPTTPRLQITCSGQLSYFRKKKIKS